MRMFVIMVLCSISLMALDLPKKIEFIDDPQKIAQKMMDYFIKGSYDEGLEIAKKYWVLSDREIDQLGREIQRHSNLIYRRFGQSLAQEFIKTQKVGKSFIRYYYLQKFENHAIYWQFTFYRPKALWQINEINFKDDLDILFE